jgi:hypothetical protein
MKLREKFKYFCGWCKSIFRVLIFAEFCN